MSLKHREAKECVGEPSRSINDLFSLKGRAILITGGVGAMGLEVARSVVETGGDVICVDLMLEPPAEAWTRLLQVASLHDGHAAYKQCNITDQDSVTDLFRDLRQLYCPLRGLITCHGLSAGGPSMDFSMIKVRELFDVNFNANYMCAQAAAKEFQRLNVAGSIVMVASMSAHGCNKGVDTSAYNSSKAALVQLARSLAAEWGAREGCPLIRVNTISPGYIRTRQTAETLQDPEMDKQWCQDNMLMRLSHAHEYRGAAMFLLSDASSFVTGTDIRVDGGHTAW